MKSCILRGTHNLVKCWVFFFTPHHANRILSVWPDTYAPLIETHRLLTRPQSEAGVDSVNDLPFGAFYELSLNLTDIVCLFFPV